MQGKTQSKPKPKFRFSETSFLSSLIGKDITVVFVNGEARIGRLKGYDQYHIFMDYFTDETGPRTLIYSMIFKQDIREIYAN